MEFSFDSGNTRRWRIATVVMAAIAVSYFDRQTLSIAVFAIQRNIHISDAQFSELQAAFLLAYAFMYAGGGRLLDALGTRRGFASIMTWWSLACASQGLATSVSMLGAGRFLLGMGEGGGFPAATKAVREQFSSDERATAMGLINAGTAVGAILAPPVVAAVIIWAGWRWAFGLSGGLGMIWTIWWLAASKPLGEGEGATVRVVPIGEKVPWLRLAALLPVQGLVVAKFLSDSAWYFYLFWLPKYLYDVRGFDTKRVGYWAWIPYAASGLGSLGGGMLSSALLRHGVSLDRSRKIALGLSAAVMPVILLVSRSPVQAAIVIFSITFLGQQSWSGLIMTIPADLFPANVVGSVAGMVGFGGAIGGVIFNLIAGKLLAHGFGYSLIFAIVSTFHIAAFGVILLTNRRIGPVSLAQGAA
jgi:ACS family hexuronate transporter-like MFS transporter